MLQTIRYHQEQLLAAIEDQIDVINGFLQVLEQSDTGTNPDIVSWINSLNIERDILRENLQELTGIVNELGEAEELEQTLADLELSTEQITLLEQLVGTELSPATSIDDVLQLNNQ